jgi:hypothetical protein
MINIEDVKKTKSIKKMIIIEIVKKTKSKEIHFFIVIILNKSIKKDLYKQNISETLTIHY